MALVDKKSLGNTFASKHYGELSPVDNIPATCGEEALWKGVITQALLDANMSPRDRAGHYHKNSALAFLKNKSRDFCMVTYLAGLEPDYFFHRIEQALKRNVAWRKDKTV